MVPHLGHTGLTVVAGVVEVISVVGTSRTGVDIVTLVCTQRHESYIFRHELTFAGLFTLVPRVVKF